MSKDTNRTLTKAEERRLAVFKEKKAQLEQEGYTAVDLTTTVERANLVGPLYGLLLCIPFVVLFYVLLMRNPDMFSGDSFFSSYWIFLLVFFVGIVVHELIHGLSWSMFAPAGFKSIEFGFIWKMLTPYCTCREPLNKKGYFVGLLMPCIVLGILPSLVACFTHSFGLLGFGLVMILGASGDLLIGKMILEKKFPDTALLLDHPTDVGLVVFQK